MLPLLRWLPEGSSLSVLVNPRIGSKARDRLIAAVRAGCDLDADEAVVVRVVDYHVPDRVGDATGELIALITTLTDPPDAPAADLTQTYHQRWQHQTGKTRSTPTDAGRARYCAPRARTWCAPRSTDTG